MDQKSIKTSSSVKLLRVHLDDKLNLQIRSKPTSRSNKASDVPKL